MRVIVAAPYIFDYPTILSHRAMKIVAEKAKEMGYDVILLEYDAATPIGYLLSYKKGDILLYGGHATPRSLVGQWIFWHMLYEKNGHIGRVKNKIVVAIPACEPAKIFGALVVRSGGLGFMGSEDFMWAGGSKVLVGYDYASDFIDTWVTAHVAVLKYLDLKKAYEIYSRKCESYAKLYEEKKYPDWEWHAWAMRENYRKIRIFTG